MTTSEQATLNQMRQAIQDMRAANETFKETVMLQVSALGNSVQQKHLPLNLEGDIVKGINDALQTAMAKVLTDSYNSPLRKYADNVVAKYQKDIESIFDEVVKDAISTEEFRLRVREVLVHKIAKTMISGIDGSVDKTINQMKQDAIFRSRLTLAVNTLVDEFITAGKK